jgi:hypothetical protein
MLIPQFVPISSHSQKSLIQVTDTGKNLIGSKQSLMIESQSNRETQNIGKLLNRTRFQEMIHGCEIVQRPRTLQRNSDQHRKMPNPRRKKLMMESQSISIQLTKMLSSQFVPISSHSQISLIQVTDTRKNLIRSKQSLMME